MKRKVKITGLPKMKHGGMNSDKFYPKGNSSEHFLNTPDADISHSLDPVDRESANIEAEKGEFVLTNMTDNILPELYEVKGKRHSQGGTPLNIPEGSFVFSDNRDLIIKDKNILKEFGMGGKKGATPAKLASKFKINDYKNIINDPNADKIAKDTAMLMLKNNTQSLGKLALVQESMKGFSEGIPNVSLDYLDSIGVNPQDILPQGMNQDLDNDMMACGGKVKYADGGYLPKHQTRGIVGNLPTREPYRAKVSDKVENLVAPISKDLPAEEMALEGIKQWLGSMSQEDQKVLKDKMINEINNSKKLTQAQKDKLLGMSFNQAMDAYVNLTSQSYAYSKDREADLIDPNKSDITSGRHKKWDRGMDKAKGYKEWTNRTGVTPLTPEETGLAQAFYNAFYDYSKEQPGGKFAYTDVSGDSWSFYPLPVGNPDHQDKDKGVAISPVDQVIGDTTILQSTAADRISSKQAPNKPKETPAGQLPTKPFVEAYNEDPNRWWMEDVIKTAGAATDMYNIKKHMPWSSPIDVQTMDPTFYDPTRALAANAEQAGIAAEASAKFAGPQALGARLSKIQGEAAKNAANIMAQYDERNVNVANQFEQANKQIINQGNAANAQRLMNMYDKNTIANQQFENSKAKGRENLRQSYIDGLHRAFKNQIVNEMYPQYDFDPMAREFGRSGPGRPITGEGSYQSDDDSFANKIKLFRELKSQFEGSGVDDAWIKKEVERRLSPQSASKTFKRNADMPGPNELGF